MGSRLRGFLLFAIVCVGAGAGAAESATRAVRRPTRTQDTIQANIHGDNNVTADVLTGRLDASTNNLTDLWKWDLWCQLQPVIGICKNNVTKYYYDSQLDQCLTFRFSGCGGNRNQFASRVDCERHCKGAVFVPIKPKERDSICALQPHAGMCVGYFPKYYYDVNSGRCKQFVFSGCGGNGNQFADAGACAAHCARDHEPRARDPHNTTDTPPHLSLHSESANLFESAFN